MLNFLELPVERNITTCINTTILSTAFMSNTITISESYYYKYYTTIN